jgi:chromosome segregation ATPase
LLISNNSSTARLPTIHVTQEEEQSEPKHPRNELALIKKLPSQIKEIFQQHARIEHQLHDMNKEIKQIRQTHPDKAESRESIKQIKSQIAELQKHVTRIENAVNNALANIKSKKKGKKKGKKYKNK